MADKDQLKPIPPRRFLMAKSGLYLLPAVSSVFFIAGSLAVGSHALVAFNLLMLFVALLSLVSPSVIAWVFLMLGSIGYLIELFSSLDTWHGSPTLGQWIAFAVIGVFPSVALWWHRPRAVPPKSLSESLRETSP